MPISTSCPNGHNITAQDELAGQSVRCPKCDAEFVVPQPTSVDPFDDLPQETVDEEVDELEELTELETFADEGGSFDDPLATDDPLAGDLPLGDPLPNDDHPLSNATALTLPQQPRPAPATPQAAATRHAVPIWSAAVAGTVVGLLVVGMFGFVLSLFSGSGGSQVAANTVTSEPSNMNATTTASAPAPSTDETSPAATGTPSPAAPVAKSQPQLPPQAPTPTDVTPLDIGKKARVFRLPAWTWGFAYDEPTGRIAVTNDKEGGVLVYEVEQLLAGHKAAHKVLLTKGQPTAVIRKPWQDRSLFIISGTKSTDVQVIDANTLELIGEVTVADNKRGFAHVLGASINPEDPYVYFSTGLLKTYSNRVSLERDHMIGRFDLNTMKVAGRIPPQTKPTQPGITQRGDFPQLNDIALSADGEVVYYGEPRDTRLAHAGRWKADGGPQGGPSLQRLGGQDKADDCIPDPIGNWIITGKQVSSRGFRARVKYLDFDPKAFFRTHPLLIAFKKGNLAIASSNDYRVLQEISLPPDWFSDRVRRDAATKQPGIDFRLRNRIARRNQLNPVFLAAAGDDSRELAIAMTHEHLVIAPLKKLELPAEPLLACPDILPSTLDVGAQYQLEVSDDVQLEVVSEHDKPNPPTASANMLRWTPSEDHAGLHKVRIRASQGDISHEMMWSVLVQSNNPPPGMIELPFAADGVSLHAAGKRAVVWGTPSTGQQQAESELQHYIGIVDVDERKTMAHRELSDPIWAAVVGETGIYVLTGELSHFAQQFEVKPPKENTRILRLDAESLEPQGQIVLPFDCGEMRLIADRYLAVLPNSSAGHVHAVSIPAMEHLGGFGPQKVAKPGRVKDGWVWNGIVWDEDLEKPRLLLNPVQFGGRPGQIDIQGKGTLLQHFSGAALTTLAPQRPNSNQHRFHRASFDYPGFIRCKGNDLLLTDYVDRRILARIRSVGGQRENTGLTVGEGVILIANKSRTLRIIRHDEFKLTKKPLQFAHEQSTFTLDPEQPTTVRYSAPGAVRYELRTAIGYTKPLLTAESTDGAFSIDLAPLMDKLTDRAADAATLGPRVRNRQEAADRVAKYIEKGQETFRKIVGKPSQGVPFAIQFIVIAENADGEAAAFSHAYLVDIPQDAVLAKF